jgi:hypothetical protein
MKYLLTLYGDESQDAEATPEEWQATLDAYWDYDRALRAAGAFIAGEALQPSPTATTVRVRDGERALTDGPFAETREQLGGFYLLECRDLDEALDWAAKCPAALDGTIEVRAIMEFDMPADIAEAEGASAGS